MRNPLRRLLPRSETHLLMARPGSAVSGGAGSVFRVEGVETVTINNVGDPRAGALEAFAVGCGFPGGWVADMIGEGAVATVAVEAGQETPLAMGWSINRPFHVEEIGATLDPAGGVYLFGDFVAPAHRGRRLQRLLVAQRVRAIGAEIPTCTIVHPSNVASVRSYAHEGFEVTDRFTRRRWLGREWIRCRAGVGFELREGDRLVFRWTAAGG